MKGDKMDEMNTVNPADVKVKGILGTLPGEGEVGPMFGKRLWPARVRLRAMGALMVVGVGVLALFFGFFLIIGYNLLSDFGDKGLLLPFCTGMVCFVVMGVLLLSSTTSLSKYHRRLSLLRWLSLAFSILCVVALWDAPGMPWRALVVLVGFAYIFFLVWLLVGAERRALKAEAREREQQGGGPHVF